MKGPGGIQRTILSVDNWEDAIDHDYIKVSDKKDKKDIFQEFKAFEDGGEREGRGTLEKRRNGGKYVSPTSLKNMAIDLRDTKVRE